MLFVGVSSIYADVDIHILANHSCDRCTVFFCRCMSYISEDVTQFATVADKAMIAVSEHYLFLYKYILSCKRLHRRYKYNNQSLHGESSNTLRCQRGLESRMHSFFTTHTSYGSWLVSGRVICGEMLRTRSAADRFSPTTSVLDLTNVCRCTA